MDRLEAYDLVQSCDTLDELADVIDQIADEGVIQGESRLFSAKEVKIACRQYSLERHNTLTRQYGIRQQAMMILFYKDE